MATSKKLRDLKASQATLVTSARAVLDQADTEKRDLSAEESAQFDALQAKIDATKLAIQREETLLAEEAQIGGARGTQAAVIHDNLTDDPKRGFACIGEMARLVQRAAINPGAIDERLAIGAALPSGGYANESSGSDGGFLVPPEFSREIWQLMLEEDDLLSLTENTTIEGNSMVFPKDETTPWGGTGIQVFWRSEGLPASTSKPVLGTDTMRLKEEMAFVPVTNELLQDATSMTSFINNNVPPRLAWKTNEAILFGDGAGKPLGAFSTLATSSGPSIVVSKETSQTAGTLLQMNLSRMRSRLLAGSFKRAIWIANPDILPALEGMVVGQIPVFLPPQSGVKGEFEGTLFGRPLILSEHANTLGQQSDISLMDLKGYRTITKALGIEFATSLHFYFDQNATAFRFIFRIDGKPILSAPITPPKSSNTRSHFVTLGART